MRLGLILRRWRKMEDLTVRDAAKLIDLNPSTYVRFELGQSSSGKTLAKIMRWLLEEWRE